MNALQIEEKYNLDVVLNPEIAHAIYDSANDTFYRFNSWSETHDAYHLQIDSETITLRKYLHPSNRYYFIQSSTYTTHE